MLLPKRGRDRAEREEAGVDEQAVQPQGVAGRDAARETEDGGQESVMEGEERTDAGGRAERPLRRPDLAERVEHGPRHERRGDEVADVEDDDVPVGPVPQPLRHEGEGDEDDREPGRQDEHGREDRGERQVRALVLHPVGAEHVGADHEHRSAASRGRGSLGRVTDPSFE